MTHLPFIAAAYAITLGLAAWLSISATVRLSRARRRLSAYESQAIPDRLARRRPRA